MYSYRLPSLTGRLERNGADVYIIACSRARGALDRLDSALGARKSRGAVPLHHVWYHRRQYTAGSRRLPHDARRRCPVAGACVAHDGAWDGTGRARQCPANIHVEAWVPQRDVFPHATALVCHGGSGTVLGALGAGLPMVVVPLFADQPDNARRVAAVGAGLALQDPDASALRVAIERVLNDAELRSGAKKIAKEMETHATMETAIEALVAMKHSRRHAGSVRRRLALQLARPYLAPFA